MLPPLSALRAFDAASRHLSFSKAAEELCVTQSAISRQIRNLEEFLDLPLFERRHRAVVLTAEGERYKRDIAEMFVKVDQATRRLRRKDRRDVLRIQTYTTFTMRWLIPRLKRFNTSFPEIDLRLTASLQPVDFNNNNIHGAVRAGAGEWHARADKLCETYLIPVCSSDYLANAGGAMTAKDLAEVTLLHSLGRPNDWRAWFAACGEGATVDFDKGHSFESSSMAYQAAQRGLGVAIGQRFLVDDDLRSGALVAPISQQIHSTETYYFLSSPRFAGVPTLELFRDWLLAEAQTSARSALRYPIEPPQSLL